MKFKFPYTQLMQVRKREEELAMRDYLEARAQLDAANAKLRAMYDSIDQSRKEAELTALRGGRIAEQMNVLEDFIKGQKIKILQQREQVRSLLTLVEQKQEVLVKAAQEYKILEKLKENMLEDFKKRMAKLEAKEVDDLVIMRQHQRGSQ